jgi:lactoylglutathione lyase
LEPGRALKASPGIRGFEVKKGVILMHFEFIHNNINVLDLERSLKFYDEALGLKSTRRKEARDGSFILEYLEDGRSSHQLELTWLRDRKEPYNLGDNEIHLAFRVDDFGAALKKHRDTGVVCYENPDMGIYFIADPDGYWMEIVPPAQSYYSQPS